MILPAWPAWLMQARRDGMVTLWEARRIAEHLGAQQPGTWQAPPELAPVVARALLWWVPPANSLPC